MSMDQAMSAQAAEPMMHSATEATDMQHGGHLYMQTNEIRNAAVHYLRSPRGTLADVERFATGGSDSGTFKSVGGQESAPNAFEGAAGVSLSPDRRLSPTTHDG